MARRVGPAPSKVYSTSGSFTATLTVTDNQGATDTATVAISVAPAPAPPAAPTGLSASAASRTVTVRWTDNSSNESGFYIERAVKGKNPAFTRVGQVGAGVTTFVQTVTANTWLYRVQAFNANGVSGIEPGDDSGAIGDCRLTITRAQIGNYRSNTLHLARSC